MEHTGILRRGVAAWNSWRRISPDTLPELSRARLFRAGLAEINFSGARLRRAEIIDADLTRANLRGANLYRAGLAGTCLEGADLAGADLAFAGLEGVNLCGANLEAANLTGANLIRANFIGANLHGASLSMATLVETNLAQANLSDCSVFGISAWKLQLEGAMQSNLVISDKEDPLITVDNLEVAQFIHLLLCNEKLRSVIDTITSKLVLILGRFTPERKAILEAIREYLRSRNYLPVLFDFDVPANRDLTETVSTLAHMARFIVADITDARSIPQELQRVVPGLPSVPVQPLLCSSSQEYGMFDHFRRFPWVLEVIHYGSIEELLVALDDRCVSYIRGLTHNAFVRVGG